jgi:hypothetical protein
MSTLSRIWVTIDGGWIGNWIYWTLTDRNYSNYSAIANSYTLQITTAGIKSSQPAQSSPVVAWWRLPTADVPLTLGSRTIPMPELPASHSHSSQRLNRSSPLTDCSPVHFTPLYSLTSWHGPSRKHRFSVECYCYVRVCLGAYVIDTQPLPTNGRCLQSHYLVTAVV